MTAYYNENDPFAAAWLQELIRAGLIALGDVRDQGAAVGQGGLVRNPWRECDWVQCSDGKHRTVKPGVCVLAHGFPERVGLLRGFGNAIVPQVAAGFIRAVMEE